LFEGEADFGVTGDCAASFDIGDAVALKNHPANRQRLGVGFAWGCGLGGSARHAAHLRKGLNGN